MIIQSNHWPLDLLIMAKMLDRAGSGRQLIMLSSENPVLVLELEA